MIIYRILADITLILHLVWVLFTMFGSIIAYRYLWLKRIHLGMLVYTFFLSVFAWRCPLTYAENYFLEKYDPTWGYDGGFIANMIYLDISYHGYMLGAFLVIIFNLSVYYFSNRKLESGNPIYRLWY